MTEHDDVDALDEDEGHPDCVAMGHDEVCNYEDDEVWQGECRRCGAELFTDKQEDA